MLMENCYDFNCLITRYEVDRIWKPVKQCPPNVRLDFWKLKWRLLDSLHDGIKLNEELGAESGALVLIPNQCVQDIEISFIA